MAIVSSTCVDTVETRTLLRTTNDAVRRPGAALALPRHASSTTYTAQILRPLCVTLAPSPRRHGSVLHETAPPVICTLSLHAAPPLQFCLDAEAGQTWGVRLAA